MLILQIDLLIIRFHLTSSSLLFYPGFVDGLDMGNNTKVSSCFGLVLSNCFGV